jgi:tetratricopeptide (TPR) repeat protein
MTPTDATRLAGEAYCTRLAHNDAAMSDDKTRLAQEGYQSKLARDAAGEQPDVSEYYKIGDKIGDRYEVSAIHHGAMGVVYGCFDHQTKLPRALKTVRARHAHDKQVLSLFLSEATVWISLEKHPYIVRAYLVEGFRGLPFVITEYVRGPEGMEGDLRGWLGHPRLTLQVAVGMALQIAQGMQHAVRKVPNLVHRDLKPANILVNGDGKAMVTDFGLVQSEQFDAGTPAYMSPEQWRSEALDARSDIYAYGCILFEMFTAHRLFPALTERDWERAHLESTPVVLSDIVSELPSEIDEFVQRCLKKNERVRPQNWDEVVTFFAEWYHRLTGKAVVFDFSSLALDGGELFNSGYSLHNLKRYEEANQAYDRALAIDPNLSGAWYNKAYVLYHLKRFDEVIEPYDRALKLDPSLAKPYNSLSNFKLYVEVIQVCDRMLSINPSSVEDLNKKADALSYLDRYEEAIQTCDRALVIDQNNIFAWNTKGGALLGLQRYDESLQAYNQTLVIDPYNSTALEGNKIVLQYLERNEEVIQVCDIAIEINQYDYHAWCAKANALEDLQRYDEAEQAYNRAVEIDPDNFIAWCGIASLMKNLKRHEDAILVHKRILSIQPNQYGAWNLMGYELFNLKRYEEALQAFEQALAVDATYEPALQGRKAAVEALKDTS